VPIRAEITRPSDLPRFSQPLITENFSILTQTPKTEPRNSRGFSCCRVPKRGRTGSLRSAPPGASKCRAEKLLVSERHIFGSPLEMVGTYAKPLETGGPVIAGRREQPAPRTCGRISLAFESAVYRFGSIIRNSLERHESPQAMPLCPLDVLTEARRSPLTLALNSRIHCPGIERYVRRRF
jgi:hypothetical protein